MAIKSLSDAKEKYFLADFHCHETIHVDQQKQKISGVAKQNKNFWKCLAADLFLHGLSSLATISCSF